MTRAHARHAHTRTKRDHLLTLATDLLARRQTAVQSCPQQAGRLRDARPKKSSVGSGGGVCTCHLDKKLALCLFVADVLPVVSSTAMLRVQLCVCLCGVGAALSPLVDGRRAVAAQSGRRQNQRRKAKRTRRRGGTYWRDGWGESVRGRMVRNERNVWRRLTCTMCKEWVDVSESETLPAQNDRSSEV